MSDINSNTEIDRILTGFFIGWAERVQELNQKSNSRLGRRPFIKWELGGVNDIRQAHLVNDLKASEGQLYLLASDIADALKKSGIMVDAEKLHPIINYGDTEVPSVILNIRRLLGDIGAGIASPREKKQRWRFREPDILGGRTGVRARPKDWSRPSSNRRFFSHYGCGTE